MHKISESLIQFDESSLSKAEEMSGDSADRILRRFRSALEQMSPVGRRKPTPSDDELR
jgi:hypothetical protein